MRYTAADVCNRLILAKCCMSDTVIRMFDAQAIGDTENEVCLLEKALVLKGAINALCQHWDGNEYTVTYETNFTPSGGRVTINDWTFAGETVLQKGETFTGSAIGQDIVDAINDTKRTGSVSTLAEIVQSNRVTVEYTYPLSRSGSVPTLTLATGSQVSQEDSPQSLVDTESIPCLDDSGLEGIFNIVDKVCGCNCPDKHVSDLVPSHLA